MNDLKPNDCADDVLILKNQWAIFFYSIAKLMHYIYQTDIFLFSLFSPKIDELANDLRKSNNRKVREKTT